MKHERKVSAIWASGALLLTALMSLPMALVLTATGLGGPAGNGR